MVVASLSKSSAWQKIRPRRSCFETARYFHRQPRPSRSPICLAAKSSRTRPVASPDQTAKQGVRYASTPAAADAFKKSFVLPRATHQIDQLARKDLLDKEVVVHGYSGNRVKTSKKLCFLTVFDPSFKKAVQIVSFGSESNAQVHQTLQSLKKHIPVAIRGRIKRRNPSSNPPADGIERVDTVEIEALQIEPLNTFPDDLALLMTDGRPPADRRNLLLRADRRLRDSLALRGRAARACRQALERQGFLEVETPILFKSTPEGAREFLVPTRTPNLAYALQQSPQQYKQIIVASGIPRYYQIARCFRDEDLRADRQPEFTQLDVEMAFATGEDVINCIEKVVRTLWQSLLDIQLATAFPRITYDEAMARYGSDKPDRRFGMEISSIGHMLPSHLISKIGPLTDPAVDVLKMRIYDASREMHQYTPHEMHEFVASFMMSKIAADAGVHTNPDGLPGTFVYDTNKPLNGLHAFGFEAAGQLEEMLQLESGDLVVIQARKKGPFSGGSTALGRIRLALHGAAVANGLAKPSESLDFLWVTDFPMFKPNDEDPGQGGASGFSSTHHPFTAPRSLEDIDLLASDPAAAKSEHYDLVVNGIELGGGSRRIHDAAFQEYILRDVLKMSDERMGDFAHLLEVLRAGCPPHAGIALGLDRLVAVMAGTNNIKHVIAFPKNSRGEDLMVKSPSLLTDEQLATYHLQRKVPLK